MPDLRGHWYLGVYNNELSNVAYTIRAVLPDSDGLLVSAQPLQPALTPLNPPHGLLLSWNSVEGERYFVQYTASIAAPVTWTNIGFVIATTPLTTFEVLPVPSGRAFYRIVQVFSSRPMLHIQLWPAQPGPPLLVHRVSGLHPAIQARPCLAPGLMPASR